MRRREFLAVAGATLLLGALEDDVDVPVELRGGRLFALPQTTDGRTFACWLDTDGDGFIFADSVQRFALSSRTESGHAVAELPSFAPDRSIPPLATGTTLPVFERSAADRTDPILAGFEAQLGATWFANRVWRFDFGRGRLALLRDGLTAGPNTVPVIFAGLFPRFIVEAGDAGPMPMSFDIAASLAVPASQAGARVEATSFVRRETLEAWHAANPQWQLTRNVGFSAGIDRIVVPRVRVGRTSFENVAFTTRPGDDVFEGDDVAGKLGANAYAASEVTIDYRNAAMRFT